MAQISSIKCNVCDTGFGKIFCYECKHFLCDSCNTCHAKFPATKRHYVTDSHNIDRSTSLQLLCDKHKLDFVYYCQTCELFTCSSCVTTNHKGHSFIEIAEVTAKARILVSENLVILKKKIDILSDLIEGTKSKDMGFIKKESDKYINDVKQVSDDVIGNVKSITDINITRASDYYVTEKQGLEYSVAKLEKTYNEYKIICTKLEQILLQKHDVAFLFSHKSLAKELKKLDDIPDIEEPSPIEKFCADDFIDLVIQTIQNKYPIRDLILKDKEIQHLKQSLEQEKAKITELQKTLVQFGKERRSLESVLTQNTKDFILKDKEIQHLKQSLAQEKVKIREIQKRKDSGLVTARDER